MTSEQIVTLLNTYAPSIIVLGGFLLTIASYFIKFKKLISGYENNKGYTDLKNKVINLAEYAKNLAEENKLLRQELEDIKTTIKEDTAKRNEDNANLQKTLKEVIKLKF